MKVRFVNRNTVLMNARTNSDIVKWMMKHDYDTTYLKNVDLFMKSYSERKALYANTTIRFESVDCFVEDLVSNGIIEVSR
ncbi:hypothetical protein [Niabella beijingensis]|uniref:hypothetical protein n=1 Tax=Niabella beijingensis TaxID=2872700 RepID=UPI001CBEDC0C|nr:hypothetical protein [Niabella beijingensis]MBZ4190912.1 hypothetical protein [Niabella beijingensis]